MPGRWPGGPSVDRDFAEMLLASSAEGAEFLMVGGWATSDTPEE